ncbi:MAG: CarD family transcriptional regulator [Ruthenibacterium lactatiformans]
MHQNHGIGVYAGIQRLDLQGVVKDYIKINYDKADTLYVPVTQLDLISRYTAPATAARQALSRAATRGTKPKPRAQGHAGDGKELIALYARPAGPGLCVPRGQRVAAGF